MTLQNVDIIMGQMAENRKCHINLVRISQIKLKKNRYSSGLSPDTRSRTDIRPEGRTDKTSHKFV